jgi:hypothetical protein
MTATDAGQIAEGYAKAWTSGDLDTAMSFVAGDVVCDAPGGRIEGAEANRQFIQGFAGLVASAAITKILAGEKSAAIIYSFGTPWLKDFRAVDYVTIEDGTIRHVTTIVDRLPAAEAARNAPS